VNVVILYTKGIDRYATKYRKMQNLGPEQVLKLLMRETEGKTSLGRVTLYAPPRPGSGLGKRFRPHWLTWPLPYGKGGQPRLIPATPSPRETWGMVQGSDSAS